MNERMEKNMENNRISQRTLDHVKAALDFTRRGCDELIEMIDTISDPGTSDCRRAALLNVAETDLACISIGARNASEFLTKVKEMEDETK